MNLCLASGLLGVLWQAITPHSYVQFTHQLQVDRAFWITAEAATPIPQAGYAQIQQWQRGSGLVLVDVRPRWAYEQGHLPGAVSLPMAEAKGSLGQWASQWKNTGLPVVFYCDGGDCQDSQTVARTVLERFQLNALVYVGGWEEYAAR